MVVFLSEGFAERAILLAQAGVIELFLDHHPHFGERERFEDVVAGSSFHRLDRSLNRTECRHNHDRQSGILLLGGLQKFEPAHAGEFEVGKNEMNWLRGEQLQSSFSIAGGKRFESVVAQVQFKQATHLGFVFDNEYSGHGLVFLLFAGLIR